MGYRISRIPKRNGTFREIYIPDSELKQSLRQLLPLLEQILDDLDKTQSNYAFQALKNCALNAYQHIGYRYTLSLDLEDFFDSVTPDHITPLMHQTIIDQCFINGSPRQGLPTSPVITTIAFLEYDKRIINLMNRLGISAIYTRYADDLIFSFDDKRETGRIQYMVRQALLDSGFVINNRKTTLQDARNGRRIITGIAVDHHGLHATRRIRRKIRAAIHQKNEDSRMGLEEWAKCQLPSIEKHFIKKKRKNDQGIN